MESKTKFVNTALHVVSWVIFIGLCIKTGALLVSFLVTLFNPSAAGHLYSEVDLSGLYRFDKVDYINLLGTMILLTGFKAHLFYRVIAIFRKINLVHPFSTGVAKLISTISQLSLVIGLATIVAHNYSEWLAKRGAPLPSLDGFLGGGSEFLLLGAVIFIIAQIFRKGIELQAENDLTV